MQPLTALQMLKLLVPDILKWKQDALLVGFLLNNYPQGLAVNGKDLHWQFSVFSPKTKKEGIFQFDKERLVEPAQCDIISNAHLFLDLTQSADYSFLDSDWLADRMLELGIPVNEQQQLAARIFGGIDLLTNQLKWSVSYKTVEGIYRNGWSLQFDMITGLILSHRCVDTELI